jgi:predicted RNA-binding Zn-ribbon protein involved in translation (DUF1610 family)
MTHILLHEAKSKKACPCCGENKLFTNASEGIDENRDYCCLNCGYQFFENEEQRAFNELKGRNKDDLSWSMGTFTLFAMLIVVLLISATTVTTNQSAERLFQVDKMETSVFKH